MQPCTRVYSVPVREDTPRGNASKVVRSRARAACSENTAPPHLLLRHSWSPLSLVSTTCSLNFKRLTENESSCWTVSVYVASLEGVVWTLDCHIESNSLYVLWTKGRWRLYQNFSFDVNFKLLNCELKNRSCVQ